MADKLPPAVNNLDTKPKVPAEVASKDVERHVVNTVRCLGADLVQAYKGGHPGTVMGAAGIGLALWRYCMRYNPKNPNWFNRDRIVLSAGHACLLQYIYLHLTGYETWTMDELKTYHNPKIGKAAGHPEIEFDGIELTTGPLGQGIANCVGLAIAQKNLAATYNTEEFPIVDNVIWCFTGDGCLQEGVGQEAVSIAGHLGLDNLILVYDCNLVTVDGTVDSCFTDDTSARLRAVGWHVIDVEDGSNDVKAVTEALQDAKSLKQGKPVCVNIKTIIGFGSGKANTGSAHGQALGEAEVIVVKKAFGFDPEQHFVVSQEVYDYFEPCKTEGQKAEDEWKALFRKYKSKHPEKCVELERRMQGKLPGDWESHLPPKSELPSVDQPTRKSSGIAVSALLPRYNQFMAGSADLLESTFVSFDKQVEFQKPSSGLGDYSGRQIRYGIREFAMASIANGLAAYQKGAIVPVCSTFFMFWLYAAPAVRMAALQSLRFIGIATHDSLGIGEDGPTHQPVALAAFYRALPNTLLIRPADAEECMGAWKVALGDPDKPSIFALSRQPVPLLEGSDREGVARGGYPVFHTYEDAQAKPQLVLVATGTEVIRAIDTAKLLKNYKVRVVSMPCQVLFDQQPKDYRSPTLGHDAGALVVAIEAWTPLGWAKYAHASLSLHTFGLSAPQAKLFDLYGFEPAHMAEKISTWAAKYEPGSRLPQLGDFEELLLGHFDPTAFHHNRH